MRPWLVGRLRYLSMPVEKLHWRAVDPCLPERSFTTTRAATSKVTLSLHGVLLGGGRQPLFIGTQTAQTAQTAQTVECAADFVGKAGDAVAQPHPARQGDGAREGAGP